MNAQTIQPTRKTSLLRTAIRANAIFSASSGLIFVLASSSLAALTGIQPQMIFIVLGAMLAVYGLMLWGLASMNEINTNLVWAVIIADVAWVAGSVVLLLSGWVPLTTAGKWLVALLADAVGILAVIQYIGLRRELGK